jgi:drug/metabolite transporter (DMT)-like permease
VATVVLLALSASLIYGASDFLGALTARRLTVVSASSVIYLAATAVSALALPILPWVYSDRALWSGTVAGVFGTVGMVTFYAALAIGPMSLLAPLIALIQTAVPVAVAAATGQSLSPVAWIAVGLALVATTLISIPATSGEARIERISTRGGTLALLSGVTLGLSVVSLDTAPPDSGAFPAFLDIAVGLVLLLPLVAVRRFRTSDDWLRGRAATPAPDAGGGSAFVPTPAPTATRAAVGAGAAAGARLWAASAVAGALLGIGNILLVIALHQGNLAVVAVLVSLYPLGTVVLARLVLKERISLVQFVGVGLAIVAAILLGTS